MDKSPKRKQEMCNITVEQVGRVDGKQIKVLNPLKSMYG